MVAELSVSRCPLHTYTGGICGEREAELLLGHKNQQWGKER